MKKKNKIEKMEEIQDANIVIDFAGYDKFICKYRDKVNELVDKVNELNKKHEALVKSLDDKFFIKPSTQFGL